MSEVRQTVRLTRTVSQPRVAALTAPACGALMGRQAAALSASCLWLLVVLLLAAAHAQGKTARAAQTRFTRRQNSRSAQLAGNVNYRPS